MASKCDDNDLENFIKFSDLETPEKMEEIARSDFGETEELKEKCLKEMKALVKEHELTCLTRDDFLLRFLRTNKFDVQASFRRLQSYSKHRVELNNRLMELRPEVLEKCLRLNIVGYLPYRDHEESLIFFFTTGGWNPDVCSDEEMLVILVLLANYASEYEYSQLTGAVMVFDNTSIPLKYTGYVLRHAYFGSAFLFNSLPMRFRAVHSINEGFVINYVLRLVDPFVPEKLKRALILHGQTRDKFFQYLPRCVIPDEYGGSLGPLSNDHLIDPMLEYLQKMKDEQRYFVQGNF